MCQKCRSSFAYLLVKVWRLLVEIDHRKFLTDVKVEALYKLVCSPGGMVPNSAGLGAQIVAPGCGVSMRPITNLKLACYFVHHQTRTSQDCAPVDVTLAWVRELRLLRNSEVAYTTPNDKTPINDKNGLRHLSL